MTPSEPGQGEAPDVDGFATVVVAYGSVGDIADVVRGALALPGCRRVVVVDNGTDGSADAAEAAGASVLRRPDNPGFGISQNAGVATTDEPAVLLLNPDAGPQAEGLEAGLALLRAQPDVGAVQGIITNRFTHQPERSMGDELRAVHLVGRAFALRRLLGTGAGRALARRAGVGDHVERVPDGPVDVETLAAAAVLVRRTAFDAIGGFDETYFLYGEDLDLCRRLRLAGWRLVGIPVPWAEHDSGGTSASSWERELHWWRGTMGFGARWWPAGEWRIARAAALVRWLRLAAVQPRGARRAWAALLSGPADDRRRLRHPAAIAGRVR